MELTGWGRYPRVEASVSQPRHPQDVIAELDRAAGPLIPRGLGRSYGDSALAPLVMDVTALHHLLAFDEATGALCCAAGTPLADILAVFAPRGWFLPVTPGTRFVTVGGAIASDVHGKNHHLAGSFSDHVLSLEIATASGEILVCSRQSHPALFAASCGGMGLTGVILQATLSLKPIGSTYIQATTLKASHLDDTLDLFDTHAQASYSVAWIDCLSTGKSLGRSLISLGEHAPAETFDTRAAARLTVPFELPGTLLNRYSIRAFNALYYHRLRQKETHSYCHYQSFFYPLDGIRHWNRLYGRKGFVQYQCVFPREAGRVGLHTLLQRIARSGKGSFLAVLKALGKGNGNPLSFPLAGYTLALDFKLSRDLLPLLDELDRIIIDHGGRLYLTKDARMSETTFKAGYPDWTTFQATRANYDAIGRFDSQQSQRLGL